MKNRLFKKIKTIKKLIFKRFLLTVVPSFFLLLLTAIMLGWFVQFESNSFYESQKNLATGAVKGTVHNLSQLVAQRHQAATALVQYEQQLLLEIADFPVDEDNLSLLRNSVKNRLPEHFTYLLSDSLGAPLLEEKVIKLGTQCRNGLMLFSETPENHYKTVVMHGSSPQDYHFDVMVDIEQSHTSPIFFVSFKIKSLIELLKNSQIPGQSLLVINNVQPRQIELSSKGVFQSESHGDYLTYSSLARVLYKESVPGTGWSILALPDTDIFSEYRNELLLYSGLFFAMFSVVLMIFLWRIWIEERSRVIAEDKLRMSNEGLELKVVQRTEALEKSERDLQKTFMSAPYGMLVINDAGIIELINNRAEKIFGYDINELLNRSMDILLPDNIRHLHAKHTEEFNIDRKTRIMGKGRHLKGRKKNGLEFAVEIGLSPLDHSEGRKVIVSISDVSELVLAEQKLMEEHERAIVTLSSIGDGVITTDIEGEIKSINPVAERLSGWQAKDAIGRHISQVFMVINEKNGKKVNDPVIECLAQKKIIELGADTILINRHGMEIPIEDTAAPILSSDGLVIGAVLVFHDVSQSRAHANEIEYQANHDALTGLLNRRAFDRRLKKCVEKEAESRNENCLLFMDLDRFKAVNDSAGHAAGDELLRQLTTLISSKLRQRDTFARLGGDEFGVLLEFCSQEVGLKIANKLRSCVEDFRFFWEGQVFNIGVSIGVAVFSNSDKTVDELLSEADTACYWVKESGRNRVQIYDPVVAKTKVKS